MSAWTRDTACKEIEDLIQAAPDDLSLSHAEQWKGQLTVWLQRTSMLCRIPGLGEQLRSIAEEIKRLNLVIQRDWGTGDPNWLNPPILTQCLDFARLARDLIADCSQDSRTNLQDRRIFEGRDLASRMYAAREAMSHTQEQAAQILGLNVSTWKRIETEHQSPEANTITLIEQYISRAKAITELRAKGVIDFSDPQRIKELFRDPEALASLRSRS